MMRRLLFIATLLFPLLTCAQDTLHITSRKYIAGNSILLGVETASAGVVARVPTTGQQFSAYQFEVMPRLGYFPTRFLALGVTGGYGWRGGNSISHLNWYNAGGFARFYLFMRNRDRLLGVDTGNPESRLTLFRKLKPSSKRFAALSLFPFVEFELRYSNVSQDSFGNVTIHNRLNQPLLLFRTGFQARFLKRFYISWEPSLGYYPNKAAHHQFRYGLGSTLEFIHPLSNREARLVSPVIVPASEPEVPGSDSLSAAQQDRQGGRPHCSDSSYQFRIVVGSSLTYIWDPEMSHFREYTWAVNLAFSPRKRLYIGANLMNVWISSDTAARQHFQLAGAFAQYHIGNKQSVYMTPELGYYRGNYCTCGPENPHRRAGINYLAVGGGFGVHIFQGLEADIGFMVYQPLLSRKGLDYAYSYTQYVLGLNYEFRLKQR
ncbi:MAG: hypothetical protein U0176_08045 [Bacteroidia bacterium]